MPCPVLPDLLQIKEIAEEVLPDSDSHGSAFLEKLKNTKEDYTSTWSCSVTGADNSMIPELIFKKLKGIAMTPATKR